MSPTPIQKTSEASPARDAELAAYLRSAELELPLLPEASARVLALCQAEETDARTLGQVLERDPALAAHVLRVANSSLFAPEEEIVSMQQAVGRLGLSVVRDITIGVALRTRAFAVPGQEPRLRVMWMHSAIAAAWARELARARRRNVEGAFLIGLLHDVGKPVVLQAVLDLAAQGGWAPAERDLSRWMDEHHEEVGARLVVAWSLPDWAAEAVRTHHAPERAGEAIEMARAARLADLCAHWTTAPSPENERQLREDPAIAGLDLYPDELDEILARRESVLEVAGAWT